MVKFSLEVLAKERILAIGKYKRISRRSSGGSEDSDTDMAVYELMTRVDGF